MLTKMLQLILHSQPDLHNLNFNNKRRWKGGIISLTGFVFLIAWGDAGYFVPTSFYGKIKNKDKSDISRKCLTFHISDIIII